MVRENEFYTEVEVKIYVDATTFWLITVGAITSAVTIGILSSWIVPLILLPWPTLFICLRTGFAYSRSERLIRKILK